MHANEKTKKPHKNISREHFSFTNIERKLRTKRHWQTYHDGKLIKPLKNSHLNSLVATGGSTVISLLRVFSLAHKHKHKYKHKHSHKQMRTPTISIRISAYVMLMLCLCRSANVSEISISISISVRRSLSSAILIVVAESWYRGILLILRLRMLLCFCSGVLRNASLYRQTELPSR